jgi:hypothetical protein
MMDCEVAGRGLSRLACQPGEQLPIPRLRVADEVLGMPLDA